LTGNREAKSRLWRDEGGWRDSFRSEAGSYGKDTKGLIRKQNGDEERQMGETTEESLREHIARIMREKGLRVRDIRRRSAGTITESYISEILKGVAANPSIEKLSALARGLGVEPVELFKVASGGAAGDEESRKVIDKSYAVRVLDMMRKIALNPDLIAIAEEVGQLSESDADVAHTSIAALRRSSQYRQQE